MAVYLLSSVLLSITYFPMAFALNNGLARVPPRGWMSWVHFECNTDCETDPHNCLSEVLLKSIGFFCSICFSFARSRDFLLGYIKSVLSSLILLIYRYLRKLIRWCLTAGWLRATNTLPSTTAGWPESGTPRPADFCPTRFASPPASRRSPTMYDF